MLTVAKLLAVIALWGAGSFVAVSGLLLLHNILAPIISFAAATVVVIVLFGVVCFGVAVASSRCLPRP